MQSQLIFFLTGRLIYNTISPLKYFSAVWHNILGARCIGSNSRVLYCFSELSFSGCSSWSCSIHRQLLSCVIRHHISMCTWTMAISFYLKFPLIFGFILLQEVLICSSFQFHLLFVSISHTTLSEPPSHPFVLYFLSWCTVIYS
jgi:hypothetical protein